MKKISLHSFLTRLIWLCVGPMFVLAAYLSITNFLDRRAEGELQAANLVKGFAAVIDQHLHARMSALHMLAESPLLDDASLWKDLYREAQGFHKGFGSHVILADMKMQMLFNTRVPFGSKLPRLPRPKGHSAVTAVLATGKPSVGDSFFGPIAEEPLVAIALPAMREGKIAYLLLTIFETRQFQEKLDWVAMPRGWELTLVDGKQEPLARRASSERNGAMDVDPAARFVVKSEQSPWSVVLDIPRSVYRQPLIRIALTLAVTLAVVTILSFLGGIWFSRRLARSMASITDNSPFAGPGPVIAEIEDIHTLLKDAAEVRDSSDKKLRESEARYRQLFQASNAGKSITFPSGKIKVNKAFCDMLGYSPEELQSKTWQELTPAVEIASITDLLAPLLRGEQDKARFEKRYIHKDGSYVWVDVSTAMQSDYDGKPLYFITTVIDITERKRAEYSLIESEKRFRELFENMAAGFVLFEVVQDDKGVPVDLIIIKANKGFEVTTGLKTLEVIGKRLTQVLPGIEKDSADWIGTYSKVALTGNFCQFEQGSELLGYYYSINAFRAGPKQCAVTFHDITERKQAELALQASEEKFRALAETSPLAIYMSTGLEQNAEYINPTFTKLFGYTIEEVPTPEKWWPLAYTDGNYRQQIKNEWQEKIEEAMATKSNIEPMETVVSCKDGSKKYISWGFVNIGEKSWAFGLDLTEQKRSEEALKEHQNNLEHLVDQRTAELRKLVKLMSGREIRMAELKREIKSLREKLEALQKGSDENDKNYSRKLT